MQVCASAVWTSRPSAPVPSPRRRDRWRRPRPAAPACRLAVPRARSRGGSRRRTAPCQTAADRRTPRRYALADESEIGGVSIAFRTERARSNPPAAAPRSEDGAAWCRWHSRTASVASRDHHDHRKRHAVAAELDELLHQHGEAAPPEPARLASPGSDDAARSLEIVLGAVHRSMNTTSSDGPVLPVPSRSPRYGPMPA